MKNLLLSFVFSFAAVNAFANNAVPAADITENKEVKIIVKDIVSDLPTSEIVFTEYRGRCLDGHTFTFSAPNLEQAQGFVNGYCENRRRQLNATIERLLRDADSNG